MTCMQNWNTNSDAFCQLVFDFSHFVEILLCYFLLKNEFSVWERLNLLH